MSDTTQRWERLNEACKQTAEAITNLAQALAEWAGEIIQNLGRAFQSFDAVRLAAYSAAEKDHPAWVHRALWSKKRRVRKKYHDRILREYWRR